MPSSGSRKAVILLKHIGEILIFLMVILNGYSINILVFFGIPTELSWMLNGHEKKGAMLIVSSTFFSALAFSWFTCRDYSKDTTKRRSFGFGLGSRNRNFFLLWLKISIVFEVRWTHHCKTFRHFVTSSFLLILVWQGSLCHIFLSGWVCLDLWNVKFGPWPTWNLRKLRMAVLLPILWSKVWQSAGRTCVYLFKWPDLHQNPYRSFELL